MTGSPIHDDSPGVELAVVQFTKALHDEFVHSHANVHDAYVSSHEREHELSAASHTRALEASHKRLADEFTSFRAFYDAVLKDLNVRLDERHAASEVAISVALEARDKAIASAFASSEKAILKAEVSIEKRADATYVALGELQRLLTALMPRSEAENRINQNAEKIDSLEKRMVDAQASMGSRLDLAQGSRQGSSQLIGFIFGAAGFLAALVGIAVALTTR